MPQITPTEGKTDMTNTHFVTREESADIRERTGTANGTNRGPFGYQPVSNPSESTFTNGARIGGSAATRSTATQSRGGQADTTASSKP